MTLIFGILTICFAYVTDKHSAAVVRFLLGIFEAGVLPAIAYYLSRFYRRSELAFRLALYIVMGPLSGAFSGLLASAILRLSRFGGTHGWQMIFVIEGIMTLAFSLLCVLDSDRQTRNCSLAQHQRERACRLTRCVGARCCN